MLFERIKKWWVGEVYYIKGVLPGIRYKRHWTAKAAHVLVDFYLIHWKWVWGTLFTICGLIVAYLKLSQ